MTSTPKRPKAGTLPLRNLLTAGAALLALPSAWLLAQRVNPQPVASAAVVQPTVAVAESASEPPHAAGSLEHPLTSADVVQSARGPWGQMQLVPLALELPDEYCPVDATIARRDVWHFAGMNREAALAFMASCGMTDTQVAGMRAATTWTDIGTSSTVGPPDDVALALSPECRTKLYSHLIRDPENNDAISPSWFRDGRVDFRVRGSGLSERSLALLKSLLYDGADGLLLFSDMRPAMRAITDPAERLRFLKAVTRKRSMMARVVIDTDSDVTALASYWGHGGREQDVRPVLDSLKYNVDAGVERPSKLNIIALLPPFVQERLYRHGEATQPAGRVPEDCFWTAFNFFSNDTPDERMHDVNYLAEVLRRDYDRIDKPGQLGDVILLTNGNGDVLHAFNYIAADVAFTKNGQNYHQPWILAPMQDVIDTYRIKTEPLNVAYFRKREIDLRTAGAR